jgi:hypothetical protein
VLPAEKWQSIIRACLKSEVMQDLETGFFGKTRFLAHFSDSYLEPTPAPQLGAVGRLR